MKQEVLFFGITDSFQQNAVLAAPGEVNRKN
jgi:hypothetical protein